MKKSDILKKEIMNWLSASSNEPVSKEVIQQSEEALLHFAHAHSIPPPAQLRDKILSKISTLNHQLSHRQLLDINHLPLLDCSANWLDWQDAVAGIEPPANYEGIHLHPLEENEKRDLFVVWVKEFVEEEVHHDLLESFLILEGTCECLITDEKGYTRIVRMGQGDFISIQLGEFHNIRVTSSVPVKAILQWIKLAA